MNILPNLKAPRAHPSIRPCEQCKIYTKTKILSITILKQKTLSEENVNMSEFECIFERRYREKTHGGKLENLVKDLCLL